MIRPAKNIRTPVIKTGGAKAKVVLPRVKEVDQMKNVKNTKKKGMYNL